MSILGVPPVVPPKDFGGKKGVARSGRLKSRSYTVSALLEYQIYGVAIDGTQAVRETGTGRTLVMSSGEVRFETDRALRAGLDAALSIMWPASLSQSVGLTLRVRGRIVDTDWKIATLTMTHYEFHTRSSSAAAPPNRAMGTGGQG